MFIPTTRDEMDRLGWDRADILLVSGDTYTDNSYNGTALVGHWLMDHGYRVGIIAQPGVDTGEDISRLGRSTQGVKVMNVSEGDRVTAVARMVAKAPHKREDGPQATLDVRAAGATSEDDPIDVGGDEQFDESLVDDE